MAIDGNTENNVCNGNHVGKEIHVYPSKHKHEDTRNVEAKCEEFDEKTNEEDTEEQDSINKARGLPIDRGWAWIVMGSMTFYLILFGGIKKNFGIFFVAFQTQFESSASVTSLVPTTQAITNSFASLFIMTVGMNHISNRTSIMIGATLLTIANLVTALATDVRFLFLSFGFMEGIGMAMIHAPMTAMLAVYFDKRRGFANGLAFSGANFGSLIFAPIMTLLFQYYGYTGTLMIVAGMTLNIAVSGSLMRPIAWFKKAEKSQVKNKEDIIEIKEVVRLIHSEENLKSKRLPQFLKPKAVEMQKLEGVTIRNKNVLQLKLETNPAKYIMRTESYDPEKGSTINKGAESPLIPRLRAWSTGARRHHTESESSQHHPRSPLANVMDTLSRSKVALYGSTNGFMIGSIIDIREVGDEDVTDEDSQLSEDLKCDSCCSRIVKVLKRTLKLVFDTSLLKNRVFLVMMATSLMYAPSTAFISVCVAPHSKDLGLTKDQTGMLLAVVGGCGLLARLSAAMFADRKCIKLTTMMGIPAIFIGVVCHLARYFTGFPSLIALAVMIGFTVELYQAMYPVILIEYLTIAKFRNAMGFYILCNALSQAATFPIVGILRDMTGHYYAPYHLLGTMSILGGCLIMTIPYVDKLNKRHREEVKDTS